MPTPIQQRFEEFARNNPAWAGWVEQLDDQWQRLTTRFQDHYRAGRTVHETLTQLGQEFGVQSDDAAEMEELRAANKRQHDTIARQAATIKRYQAQMEDVTKLPHDTRQQLIRQLQLRRDRRGSTR